MNWIALAALAATAAYGQTVDQRRENQQDRIARHLAKQWLPFNQVSTRNS